MTGSEDELAEDEEEILVYVEFEGFVGGNAFSDKQLRLDMIGIDTEHPIMQINGRFYEGTYEDAVGTYMFFTDQENPTTEDPVFDTAPTLKYFNKTRKVLKMQRVFTKHRTEVLGDSEHSQCIPNLGVLKQAGVPFKYQEEALNFWKTIRENRIRALHSYMEKQRIREEKKSHGIELDSESDEENPFAAYKHKEDVNKQESEDMELERNSVDCSENVETSKNVDKKTATASSSAEKPEEEVPIPEALPSTSKEDNAEASKSKVTSSLRKKKVGVVHDVRKKICKKKRVIVKRDDPPADKSSTAEISEEPKDIEKCATMVSTETERAVEELAESEVSQPEAAAEDKSESDKTTKQQKREAKMKEISERLKTIAEKYSNNKAD